MKKKSFIIFLSAIIAGAFVACVDNEKEFPTDKYFYEIKDVPVLEDYVIGALYSEITLGYWYHYLNNQPQYDDPNLYTGTPVLGDPANKGKYYMDKDFKLLIDNIRTIKHLKEVEKFLDCFSTATKGARLFNVLSEWKK